MSDKVPICLLTTGVPGLDTVLGGGPPRVLVQSSLAGGPGSGKTTLVHQFMFANASEEEGHLLHDLRGTADQDAPVPAASCRVLRPRRRWATPSASSTSAR